ncbi:hypothetical protein Pint_10773 [Pistacia integerrima]|uniref:Uncharacterized protein n=1 Tax=Pistacia integerrima TaxID=434235 RepID=A0ACC0XJI1_9ROSI|nr:hypothetical protein Pint_10773 [Pistacia integerrima]
MGARVFGATLIWAARLIGTGTFGCGSVIVEGEDFVAENITFENSSPEGSGQAVAIRVTADRCAFYNCRFFGWQILLEVQVDGGYSSRFDMDSTGNELALVPLEPSRSSLTIAGGPTMSNGHSTGYRFNQYQGSSLGSALTNMDEGYDSCNTVKKRREGRFGWITESGKYLLYK